MRISGVTWSSTTGQMRLVSRRKGPVQKVAPFSWASFTCKAWRRAQGWGGRGGARVGAAAGTPHRGQRAGCSPSGQHAQHAGPQRHSKAVLAAPKAGCLGPRHQRTSMAQMLPSTQIPNHRQLTRPSMKLAEEGPMTGPIWALSSGLQSRRSAGRNGMRFARARHPHPLLAAVGGKHPATFPPARRGHDPNRWKSWEQALARRGTRGQAPNPRVPALELRSHAHSQLLHGRHHQGDQLIGHSLLHQHHLDSCSRGGWVQGRWWARGGGGERRAAAGFCGEGGAVATRAGRVAGARPLGNKRPRPWYSGAF